MAGGEDMRTQAIIIATRIGAIIIAAGTDGCSRSGCLHGEHRPAARYAGNIFSH
jgi:hypothetical protein